MAIPVFFDSLLNTDNVDDGDIASLKILRPWGIETVRIGSKTFVYITGLGDDGFSVFELTPSGTLIHVGDIADDAIFRIDGTRGLASATVGSNTYLYVLGGFDDGLSAFQVASDGSVVGIGNYSDDAALKLDGAYGLTTASVGANQFLVVAAINDPGASVFRIESDGTLTNTSNFENSAAIGNALSLPKNFASLNIGTKTFVFSANFAGIVASFELSAAGTLIHKDTVNDTESVALLLKSTSDVAAAYVEGKPFLFASGENDNGISVFSVSSSGILTNVFNLPDTSGRALEGVLDLDVFTIGQDTFLSASGAKDDGVSLFHVAADGTLTDVDAVYDTAILNLDNTFSSHVVRMDNASFLLATGHFDDGVSVFEIGGLDDVVSAGSNNDTLYGLRGNDRLFGNFGNDILVGGSGGDTLDGGPGFDIASYADATVGVSALLTAPGFNAGDAAGDTYIDIEGLEGSNFDDFLLGSGGANTIWGLAGNDTLNGNGGTDTLIGGPGDDDYTILGPGVTITELTGEGFDEVTTNLSGFVLPANFEGLSFLGTGSHSGTGNALGNTIVGNSGNDTLSGLAGDDTLTGGLGADAIDGGANGANGDTASYAASQAGVNVQLQYNIANGGDAAGDTLTGIENLTGSEANDTLVGTPGPNVLIGNGGNDVLKGLNGADRLLAGAGDDWLYIDSLDTQVLGGIGTDRLIVTNGNGVTNAIGSNGIEIATGNAGNDRFYGGASTANLTVRGLAGDDIINGGGGDDFIYGGAGVDELRGGAGLDRLYVDEHDTVIDGGAGPQDRVIVQQLASASSGVMLDMAASRVEVAYGNANDDTFDGSSATVALSLYGRNGQDILIGGSGNDRLYGDNNDAAAGDVLNGGTGNDFLYGGINTGGWAERDRFAFDADWGNDRIFDFADNG
ncbi:MAG: hypothetical protein KDJ77_18360, partial [Rhodobiaceae bacterium]|nr:hypothetical protein [Rhodobiaceae bacterium]